MMQSVGQCPAVRPGGVTEGKEWRQSVSQAKRPERKDASKADLGECSL